MNTGNKVITSGDPPRDSASIYANPLLIMMMLAFASSYMDRTIIGTLAQAIKLDLKINDTQLGLLQGLAFSVLYSVLGIPIARLCERRDRITIMSVCIAVWSGMTLLCGTAQSYLQLLIYRIGVGVGEAGCNPPAYSMIADTFSRHQKARAIGLYNLGVPIGTMIGAVSGGLLAEHLNWRIAFLLVGMPGFVLALLLRSTMKDPPRVHTALGTEAGPRVSFPAFVTSFMSNPALRNLAIGFTLTSFSTAGINAFIQPFFIRGFGLTFAQIGVIFGLTGGAIVSISMLVSARLTDRIVARDVRWHAWLPAIGVGMSAPLAALTYVLSPWPVALAGHLAGMFCVYFYVAATLSGLDRLVGPRHLAMAVALLFTIQNLAGLGAGPVFTGMAIDALGHHLFTLGDFGALCPAGVAPPGAEASLEAACKATLVDATRLGLLLTVAVKLWAATHFILASRHITDAPAFGEVPNRRARGQA